MAKRVHPRIMISAIKDEAVVSFGAVAWLYRCKYGRGTEIKREIARLILIQTESIIIQCGLIESLIALATKEKRSGSHSKVYVCSGEVIFRKLS